VAAILGLGACVYLVHFFSRAGHRAIEGQTRQAGSAPAHA
jgi:hypothetical protein